MNRAALRLCEPPPPARRSRGGSRRTAPGHLGRAGEEAAARFLTSLGYRIQARGFRTRLGEIDLVAEEAGTLVFVEVKSRTSLTCGTPAEAVDARKRSRLLRAAAVYLLRQGCSDHPCRFDVVEVLEGSDGSRRITLIRDAFQAS
jgi:putative endonuclease